MGVLGKCYLNTRKMYSYFLLCSRYQNWPFVLCLDFTVFQKKYRIRLNFYLNWPILLSIFFSCDIKYVRTRILFCTRYSIQKNTIAVWKWKSISLYFWSSVYLRLQQETVFQVAWTTPLPWYVPTLHLLGQQNVWPYDHFPIRTVTSVDGKWPFMFCFSIRIFYLYSIKYKSHLFCFRHFWNYWQRN